VDAHAQQATMLRIALSMAPEIDMSQDLSILSSRDPCPAPAGLTNPYFQPCAECVFPVFRKGGNTAGERLEIANTRRPVFTQMVIEVGDEIIKICR